MAMPILLGVILGVFLTVAGAFVYDTTTGRAPNGLPPSAAGGRPPMVNWNVVSDNGTDCRRACEKWAPRSNAVGRNSRADAAARTHLQRVNADTFGSPEVAQK